MRLGGTDKIKVDVRIVAASNVELLNLVREGRFREDLYHRLNVIHLQLPPLRDRREDIPRCWPISLAVTAWRTPSPCACSRTGAMKLLMDYDWPGNVRELENVVERAVVLSTHESIDVDLLPESIRTREIVRGVRVAAFGISSASAGRNRRRAAPAPPPSLFEILEEVERRIIMDMLERTNWNQTEAAERFQIPLSTLNQKIKRLGIETRRKPAARGAAFGYGGDEPVEFSAGK